MALALRGSALSRKLLRDLWQLKGQAAAIAAVIAAGIAVLVGMYSMYGSMRRSTVSYYDRYRLGDVFASLKRAPDPVARDLAAIPGVSLIDRRVVAQVVLDVPGLDEPAVGRILSIPDAGRPLLCDVHLRAGRLPEPGREDEVLAAEAFATANKLHVGDSFAAVIHGRWKRLRVVGLALSPEYTYTIRPGDIFPDDRRFGIFWMRRRALAAAVDMEDAFNDVVLQLMPGASEPSVIAAVDGVLGRWGGVGAYGRHKQMSASFLENELVQLRWSGIMVPIVFLLVAAFLLNVVVTRLIGTQRAQIATLKAFGYTDGEIAWHYLQLTLLIVVVGDLGGVALGAWMGRGMAALYTDYFHFPSLVFDLSATAIAWAVIVSAGAGVLGGWQAVRRVSSLPPAEAMQPEPPPVYRRSLTERMGIGRFLSMPSRMIVRNLERRPGRALLSIIAMAFAASIVVMGGGQGDSIDWLLRVQFTAVQRDDVMVTFVEPRGAEARFEVERLPGVLYAEPFRAVAATLRFGPRSEDVALTGLVKGATLRRIAGQDGIPRNPPSEGLSLTRQLAEKLGLRLGDRVRVEVKEGERLVREERVVELVDEMVGSSAYLELSALQRLLGEGDVSSGAYLRIDTSRAPELYHRLKNLPGVAGVGVREALILQMRRMIADNMNQSRIIIVLFAVVITFGVIYNAARIALAERARELASLRVLGLTRGEISAILLGELAIITVAAIPLGWVLGYAEGVLLFKNATTDYYRIPMILAPSTYAFSAVVMLVSAAFSALVVRRRLDQLDLVEVLKTRE